MALSPYAKYGTSTSTGTQLTVRKHVVTGSETVQSIAAYENPNAGYDSELWRQLAEFNGVDDLDTIVAGTVLTVPPPLPSLT